MTPLDEAILIGVWSDLRAIAWAPIPGFEDRQERARVLGLRADLKPLGVPLRLREWIGGDWSDTRRKAAERTLTRLEARGLVVVGRAGSRRSHVKLTREGRKLARALCPPQQERRVHRTFTYPVGLGIGPAPGQATIPPLRPGGPYLTTIERPTVLGM